MWRYAIAAQNSYEYADDDYDTNSTTPLVKKITQNGISFEYAYDTRGNIVSEKRDNLTTTYAYDALGQLIRVNDPHENATWIYNYDRGGNIISKAKYAYTTGTVGAAQETIPYTYGDSNWKDKLTAYNGTAITYDAIGNPLNDGTWAYTWNTGRQLTQMAKNDMTIQFKYDHTGLRVGKTITENGVATTTNYTLHGKLVTHMTVGSDKLHFFYDAQSRPTKVNFNGVTYTYLHNLQGDIVGIIDNTGNLVVEYKYDAWGKPISIAGSLAATLGKRNPFRYRGYVYDTESGMYYLRSRYYDINTSRFINSDSFIGAAAQMLGHNTYAYCFCSPILFVDQNGYRGILADFIINFCQQLSAMKLREDKINITLAADAALALKDYPLADALFTNFLWGEGKTIGGDTSQKLSDALSTSKEFEEKIRRDYWLFGAPIKSSVTFTQGDLHYAIGSANYKAEVLSCGNMLHITGVLSDIYDFTEIRSHDDPRFSWLSVEANNLGVNLQRGGHGFAYSYQVYFEMDIPLR